MKTNANSPELSVIIPVYNVEQYLGECLDSIMAQTFRNFECILVDDGSTDRSGKICDEYAQKDSRFIVLHTANGGLSAARNTGIAAAKGEYLGFVDSDDYIDPRMLSTLVANIKESGADISACGYIHLFTDQELPEALPFPPTGGKGFSVMDRTEALHFLLVNTHGYTIVCNKIYRRSGKDILFDLRSFEDVVYSARQILNSDKTVICPEPLYIYRKRRGSLAHGKSPEHYLRGTRAYVERHALLGGPDIPQDDYLISARKTLEIGIESARYMARINYPGKDRRRDYASLVAMISPVRNEYIASGRYGRDLTWKLRLRLWKLINVPVWFTLTIRFSSLFHRTRDNFTNLFP